MHNPIHELVWERCWRVIATMQGLQELHVSIERWFRDVDSVPGAFLESLRTVKAVQVFEVDAPWL